MRSDNTDGLVGEAEADGGANRRGDPDLAATRCRVLDFQLIGVQAKHSHLIRVEEVLIEAALRIRCSVTLLLILIVSTSLRLPLVIARGKLVLFVTIGGIVHVTNGPALNGGLLLEILP